MSDRREILYTLEEFNRLSGVDVMDQLFSEYTTQRQTRRWTLSFFFNILDVAALAAYILYHENNPQLKKSSTRRKIFLRSLAEELCTGEMQTRASNTQIMRHPSTKKAVETYVVPTSYIIRPSTSSQARGSNQYTGTCYLCHLQPENRSRRTRKSCSMCGKPMCLPHSVTNVICAFCANLS